MVPFIITIIVILVVVATCVALWWWRISARFAPYDDERERMEAAAKRPTGDHVVVVGKKSAGEATK